MNKLLRNILVIVAVLATVTFFVSKFMKKKQKQLSPQAKIEFRDSSLIVKMVYCQPYKKGRLIFGDKQEGALQPFGQYWRLGANEATTLETNKDLQIKGHVLPKGIYSVYAVPGKEIWKFGFNKVANRWGISEPDYNKNLFVVEVPVSYTSKSEEQFTITIEKNKIIFWWDTSKEILPFEVVK